MQIYKNTVALEACPAKTAETVSYTATFTVLGWLLLSNYSGFGFAEQAIASAESQATDSITPQELTVNEAEALLGTQKLNARLASAEILIQALPVVENSNFSTEPAEWHANLESYHRYESQVHQRAFSTDGWKIRTSDAGREIAQFMDGLVLALPSIDTADLLDANATSEIVNNSGLASETELIRGITVTGAAADRITNRPDNIRRPQIPRPYRAQEIQRSLLLPPRIQALRP